MQHALRYGSLVAANYVITLAVVTTAGHVGDRYLVAKVVVVAGSTLWNFLLYRHWVFTPPRTTSWTKTQVLLAVPAYDDEDPVGSPGDRGSRREGLLGGSGATDERDPGHTHQT